MQLVDGGDYSGSSAGETVLLALMTRETVAVETPASFAMSFTVAWAMLFSDDAWNGEMR